jgi:hypothetical protein
VGVRHQDITRAKNVGEVSSVEAVVDFVVLARVSAGSGVAVVEPRRGAAWSSCGC